MLYEQQSTDIPASGASAVVDANEEAKDQRNAEMYLLENGEMLQSFEGSRSHIEATNAGNVNV